MAKTYNININNGSGTENILNDTYSVSANVTGYDNSSIDPSSLQVVEGTNTYSLSIEATGTLTIHVTDTGLDTGVPIVGATFIRTDSSGNEYGSAITSSASGDAVFEKVPFDDTSAPIIYFKQTASDGEHEFSKEVQNTTLSESTKTIQIANSTPALRTINLNDKNYNGLPLNGTITLS